MKFAALNSLKEKIQGINVPRKPPHISKCLPRALRHE
jgi:hypothetical protein